MAKTAERGKLDALFFQDSVAVVGSWHKFLADNRDMSPLTTAEKNWFSTY